MNNTFLKGNLYLANPQAAGIPTISCPATDKNTIFTDSCSDEGSCGVSSATYCNEKGEVIVRISECVCFVVTPSITSSTSDCAKLTTSCDCYGHAQKI